MLKGKNILITGGAGFIGSHLVDRLVEERSNVIVLDNLVSGKLENIRHNLDKVRFIEGDIRDEVILEKVMDGIDYVLHQAALRSVPKSVLNPYDYHDVNVTGTLKIFLKAKEKGVRRIVFASSSSIYGEQSVFPTKEDIKVFPISPYAATKLICEYYAYVFHTLYGLSIISLRYFNVFGPRQSLDDEYAVVVPKFINCLIKGENPPIYGDGYQERDFTYIDNVVEANIKSLLTDLDYGVFNIANGDPHSVRELLDNLKEVMNKKDIEPVFLPHRPGDVRKTHADISKARNILHWEPKVGFREGLVKAVDWFLRK